MIIDAHHHLWDTERLRYTLLDKIPPLRRPFRIADFEELAARNGVEGSVCVEAASAGADALAEARWLLEQSRQSAVVSRLVVWAPIERQDLRQHLNQVAELDDGRIVGVRRSFEFEPPDFPSRNDVITGVKMLAGYGYSFDLVLYHSSLAAAVDLIRACPEVQFILDHMGKPDIRRRVQQPWREQIAAISRLPNVVSKISGIVTEAEHQNWTREDLKPYIDHTIECFGWDRVLFGSDWPVCLLAGGYECWLEALSWVIASASEANKWKLFRENACRVYRLDVPSR